MVNRLSLTLEQPEYDALLRVSLKELRDPESQIRHILREELERRGLLKSANEQADEEVAPCQS